MPRAANGLAVSKLKYNHIYIYMSYNHIYMSTIVAAYLCGYWCYTDPESTCMVGLKVSGLYASAIILNVHIISAISHSSHPIAFCIIYEFMFTHNFLWYNF